jgi:hypothetical protein
MPIFEAVIKTLITIAVIVLCMWLALWALQEIGLAIPAMVVHILWVIVILIAILVIVRLLVSPYWSSWWGPPRR